MKKTLQPAPEMVYCNCLDWQTTTRANQRNQMHKLIEKLESLEEKQNSLESKCLDRHQKQIDKLSSQIETCMNQIAKNKKAIAEYETYYSCDFEWD